MLHVLKLLIPALLPSWNFFDYITPSPRVQFQLLHNPAKALNKYPNKWQEYRPRPKHLSLFQMLRRMLWNSHWNETMFVAGCAERIAVNPNEHSESEILNRITSDLLDDKSTINLHNATYIQFRLVFIERENEKLTQETVFHSRIKKIPHLLRPEVHKA